MGHYPSQRLRSLTPKSRLACQLHATCNRMHGLVYDSLWESADYLVGFSPPSEPFSCDFASGPKGESVAVTLRDIAKRVNLSHATVSFVLNDRRDVAIPETTRSRVLEAAKELGYQPNRAARALVMGRTRVIGIWTPPLTSTYLSGLFLSLTDRFRRAGLDSLFCGQAAEEPANPFGWPIDGIVYLQGAAMPERLQKGMPVVEIGSRPPFEADWVRIDMAPGVTEAVRHLIEIGRKHVLCLANEGDVGDGSLMAVFRRAIAIAGRTADRLALGN